MPGQLHSELRQRDNRELGQATEMVLAALFGAWRAWCCTVHGATSTSAKRDECQGHVLFSSVQ
jgi:hypothetical protein